MITSLKLILISYFIACASTTEKGDLNDESIESMISDFDSVSQVYFPNLNLVINSLNSINQDEHLSEQCKKSLIRLTNGIKRKEFWALSFYDSSSQGRSGKFSGLKADFGHFDECIRSTSHSSQLSHHFDPKQINFRGQFCMLSIRTNEYDVIVNQNPYLYNKTMSTLTPNNRQWYEFNLGNIAAICIPSTCEIDRILAVINQKLVNSNISIVSQAQCSKLTDLDNRNFSLMELVSTLLLGGLVACALVGTYKPVGWLRHFDLLENNRKLFKKVTDPERERYKTLHGFKFFYLLLSIMAHVWFIFMPLIPLLFGGNRNYDIGNILFREMSAGSLYLPDVMFLIGGLLTCVLWYPLFEKKKGNISFFKYALLRWCRTTPVIVSILLIGYIYPSYGSGPFFKELANHMQTNCQTNFWKNLLYIANFDRGLNMCLPQTWYICCDFQLYLLHYITIFYLYKRPTVGLSIAAFQMLASCLYIFWSTYFNELPSYLRVNEVNLLSIINTEYHYLDTMVHSNIYTLGILCGWLMVTKRNILKVKPMTDNLISFASVWISLSIFFIPRYLFDIDADIHSMSRSEALWMSLWASIVRLIYVFFFVYAFYSYSFGGARYLRFLITYDFQVPFSRICLSIVVAQFIYILYYFGSRRDMISFTTFDQTKEGIAAFMICSFAGYVLYLIVEAPFSNILTDFVTRKRQPITKVNDSTIESILDDRYQMNDKVKDENNLIGSLLMEQLISEKKIS